LSAPSGDHADVPADEPDAGDKGAAVVIAAKKKFNASWHAARYSGLPEFRPAVCCKKLGSMQNSSVGIARQAVGRHQNHGLPRHKTVVAQL